LSGTQIKSVRGILNGTCNYLLSEMLQTGRSYDDVLADAQRLGYAESDPFLDVSGTDAAHKIAIISTLAFSAPIDFSKVSIHGVDTISLKDLELAKKLDHKIKLIAEATLTQDGVICRVEPVVLPKESTLALIDGPLNAAMIDTDNAGAYTLTGPGAGAGPTASAVLGDISALFSDQRRPVFGVSSERLTTVFCPTDKISSSQSRYLIRVELIDRAGALASLTDALAGSDISVDVLLQDSAGSSEFAPVAIMTHNCSLSAAEQAVKSIGALDAILDLPRLIRIESS
jgi:homoserine dehydrogenase